MPEYPLYFYLDGDELVPIESILDPRMMEMWNNPDRRRIDGTWLDAVGNIIPGDPGGPPPVGASYWVSTVFLTVNHAYLPDEKPLLFETMVFGPSTSPEDRRYGGLSMSDLEIRRYHTAAEARAGHQWRVGQVQVWLEARDSLDGFDADEDVEPDLSGNFMKAVLDGEADKETE